MPKLLAIPNYDQLTDQPNDRHGKFQIRVCATNNNNNHNTNKNNNKQQQQQQQQLQQQQQSKLHSRMTYMSNVKILHFTKIRNLDQFLTSSDLMTTMITRTKKTITTTKTTATIRTMKTTFT